MWWVYLPSVRVAVSGAARVDYDFGSEKPVWRLLMMNVRRSLSGSQMTAGLALAAMALAGCVVEVSVWTPIGTDASATGSWTLNGASPTPGACDAAGIDSVEFQFNNRLDSPVIPAQFVFACEAGGFNLSNVLSAGTYDTQVFIRTTTGTVSGTSQTVTANVGGTVVFAPFDITSFTPIGNDASAVGSWTLNGVVPTAAACAAAGVNTVELEFSRGSSSVIPSQFVFNCAAGGFNLPTSLAAGTYGTRFVIRRSTGVIDGPTGTFTAAVGDTVTFPVFDIVAGSAFNPKGDDFTIDGVWTINSAAATAATCGAAGIDAVQLVIQQAGDTYTEPGFIFNCAGGRFDTRTITPPIRFTYGNYMTFWRALDATGANIGMSAPLPLVVGSPIGHATLATADFVVAATESMIINLTYDTVVGPVMSDSNCSGAGVARIYFTLTDITAGASMVVSESGTAGIACTGQIIFEDDVVTAGHTYSIYLEGANSAGQKNWNAMDATLDVAAGEMALYNIALTKVL